MAVNDFPALQYIAKQTINTNVASYIDAIVELLARNIEVFKQYLDAGADANAMGGLFEWTLLHEAANVSRKEIVELLIAEGADVNAKDYDGYTALDLAIQRKHPKTADLLRKHGGKTGEELKATGN